MARVVTLLALTLAMGCSAVLDFDPFRSGKFDAGPAADAGPDAGLPDADADADLRDAATDAPAADACVPDGECGDGIRAVTAGDQHTCVIDRMGGAWCWGANASGQVGRETAGSRVPNPSSVLAISTASSISAGGGHTCAVQTMKTWCWGANTEAQLADTTRVSRSAPAVTIDEMVGMPAGGPAISVALGFEHTCDLRSDARMRCAGSDSDGQIGIGPTAGDVVRLTEVSALTGVRQITSGGAHTCAVIDDGSLHCWGRNMEGQLGIDTTDDATMPVHVSSLADVAFASAGRNHTCAIAGGTLHCWGDNAENQLGVGDADPHLSPTPVTIPGDPPVVRVSAGDRHSCAVTLAGDLYCWGANESNQLGTGEVDPLGAPEAPIAIPGPVADVVAGTRHTCALTMPGDVYCWGDNRAGQLGTGSTSAPIAEPTRVAF